MKKFLSFSLILMLTLALLAGCAGNEPAATEEPADVVAGPSMVTDESTLLTAISADGSWIPYVVSDITTEQELVLEGEFHNKGDSAQDLYRKIALYAQDEDHNVTAEYTLTAPKLTVKSPNTRIQNGTFVGDIYVEAEGFNLKGATVEGNIYFASEELLAGFVNDGGTVSGVTEVAGADAVSAPSMVNDETTLLKVISTDGTWIPYLVNDVTTTEELVVEGEFHNKGDSAQDLYRKLALYAQDADHNVTEEYTLTAPKLTVKSPNFRIQNGTFVGDIYVEAEGFNLKGADVQGNVYFANEDLLAGFVNDGGTVSGVTEVK